MINVLPKVLVLLSKIVKKTVTKVEKLKFTKGLYFLQTPEDKLLFHEESLISVPVPKKYSRPIFQTGNLLLLNKPDTKDYLVIPTNFLNYQILLHFEKFWRFKEVPGLIAFCISQSEKEIKEFHLVSEKGQLEGRYSYEKRPCPVPIAGLPAGLVVFQDYEKTFWTINIKTGERWSSQKPPFVFKKTGIVAIPKICQELILIGPNLTSSFSKWGISKIGELKDEPLLVLQTADDSYLVNSKLDFYKYPKSSEIKIPSKYPVVIHNRRIGKGIRSILLDYESMNIPGNCECRKEIYYIPGLDHLFVLPSNIGDPKDTVRIYDAKTKELSKPIKNPKFRVEGKKLQIKTQLTM